MYKTESGIVLPGKKPPLKPEPIHPAVIKIRERLAQMADDLRYFEQTCHGSFGKGTIESVCESLLECVNGPNSFSISELSQRIHMFLKEPKP